MRLKATCAAPLCEVLTRPALKGLRRRPASGSLLCCVKCLGYRIVRSMREPMAPLRTQSMAWRVDPLGFREVVLRANVLSCAPPPMPLIGTKRIEVDCRLDHTVPCI